ncbi:MAG: SDR family oxidoreductase [Planctomycetes bacterium]|nr:SDR family oxidoreductase [Planctomycetota bacterium]
MFELNDKIALVTGAGSGIGESIALTFAQAGAHVIVTDRDIEGGQATTQAILDQQQKAEFVRLDVTDEDEAVQLAQRVVDQHGHLDILVNNAGIGQVGTIEQTRGEDMDRLYAVNVKGVFNLSKAFVTGMIERKRGTIINMASIGGVVGIRDRLAYCMTKFAVVGITKAMALDHAAQGVRVNCICPCRVETPFVQARLKEYPDPEKAYREMSATQPIGRMAQPQEIAAAALYLAADESILITGTTLMADGGWSAG